MKYNTVGEALQTDEGREELQKTVKEEVTQAFQESAEQINARVISLFKVLSNAGIKIIEHKDEIEALFRFAEMINSMPEDEAKAFIEEKFKDVFESHEVLEEERQQIVDQIYRKPNSYIMPITKVEEAIFGANHNTGYDLTELNAVRVANNTFVNMQLAVYDENASLSENLTPFDRAVYDSIISIFASGQPIQGNKQVLEVMTGKSNNSPQALGAVTKSIRKLFVTPVSIDWTEHAKLKGLPLKDSDSFVIEENMLTGSFIKIRCNGQVMYGFRLLKAPALYEYSKAVKQIVSIEKQVMNIPSVSNTQETTVLKFELARQIEHMRLNNHWNRTITFDTLFKNCEIKEEKNNLTRKRKVVISILDYWKSIGFIHEYEIQKKGKVFYSITFDIRKTDPPKIGT